MEWNPLFPALSLFACQQVEAGTGELIVKTAIGQPPMRLPKGQGIAGHVANTGELPMGGRCIGVTLQ